MGVERVELVLLLLQLHGVAGLPEGGGALLALELEDAGVLGDHALGQVGDVAAVVAVLGDRLPERGRLDRGAEEVHLVAAVVDVELAGHLGARGLQDPRERVAHHRPAGVPEVQRPGRVGRDELDVDPLPAQGVVVAVAVAGGDDVGRHLALGAGCDGDVEEARPGDLDVGHAVVLAPACALTSSARARGLVPAFFASCIATLVA